MLLTVASILLVPLAALNVVGWMLAPSSPAYRLDGSTDTVRLVYALAFLVPLLGCVIADLVSFAMHRRKRDPLLIGVGALVLVLAGWAVSLIVPGIVLA